MAINSRHPATGRKRPPASKAQKAFVTLLSTADRVRAFLAAVIEPHGITGQQYNVLRIMRAAEPEGLPRSTGSGLFPLGWIHQLLFNQ